MENGISKVNWLPGARVWSLLKICSVTFDVSGGACLRKTQRGGISCIKIRGTCNGFKFLLAGEPPPPPFSAKNNMVLCRKRDQVYAWFYSAGPIRHPTHPPPCVVLFSGGHFLILFSILKGITWFSFSGGMFMVLFSHRGMPGFNHEIGGRGMRGLIQPRRGSVRENVFTSLSMRGWLFRRHTPGFIQQGGFIGSVFSGETCVVVFSEPGRESSSSVGEHASFQPVRPSCNRLWSRWACEGRHKRN